MTWDLACVQTFTDVFQRKNSFGNKMDLVVLLVLPEIA